MSVTGVAEEVARLPLSLNMQLLVLFDSGENAGPFGPRYTIILGRRMKGPVDQEALRGALTDLVERHEPLRTNIVRQDGEWYQQIFSTTAPVLEVREAYGLNDEERTARIEEIHVEAESTGIAASELPHIRAILIRLDEEDSALIVLTHHLATDGWSMHVILRDLAEFYAARTIDHPPNLPELHTYREFVQWENERAAEPETARHEAYWRETLRGARLVPFRCDYPRSAGLVHTTAAERFYLDAELGNAAIRLGRAARCTTFMVLLATYYRMLHELSGETDIVVSTHTLGRGYGMFDETVGSFFNFLPLRVKVDATTDVRELIRRTRTACAGAYENEIPAVHIFAQAPDLMAPAAGDDFAAVTFQGFPAIGGMLEDVVGNITYSGIHRPFVTVDSTSDLPDGAVWTMQVAGDGRIFGDLAYVTSRFRRTTILSLVERYEKTLRAMVTEDGTIPLSGR
jgi:hypothetical protein